MNPELEKKLTASLLRDLIAAMVAAANHIGDHSVRLSDCAAFAYRQADELLARSHTPDLLRQISHQSYSDKSTKEKP